jgi:hypothetical protein
MDWRMNIVDDYAAIARSQRGIAPSSMLFAEPEMRTASFEEQYIWFIDFLPDARHGLMVTATAFPP